MCDALKDKRHLYRKSNIAQIARASNLSKGELGVVVISETPLVKHRNNLLNSRVQSHPFKFSKD